MLSKAERMIPKKHALGLDPRVEFRFSDQIVRKWKCWGRIAFNLIGLRFSYGGRSRSVD
jgi:hypothetical protein